MDFDAVWPSARAQLVNVLRARGVQVADIDDVIQDVAVRALAVPRPFESEEHLVAWCCRVGINLHIDSTRRQRRLTVEPSPETAAPHDTAATAERRMALQVLAGEIADLSDDERRLLFEVEHADSRKEAVRLAVRRHRLRARLATVVEGLAAIVTLIRGLGRFTRGLSTPAKVSLAATPLVAAGMVLGTLTLHGGLSGEPVTLPPAVVPLGTTVPAPGVRTNAPAIGARASSSQATGARRTAPVSTPVRMTTPVAVVAAAPAGVPLRVSTVQRPDDHEPLLCGSGPVSGCVARPPGVPDHTLPSLP